jgi:hypothetical protein
MGSEAPLQNRAASRILQLIAEAADSSDVSSVVNPINAQTRADKVALELVVIYLTQRQLLQTRRCAYAESSSSLTAAHRDDWPSRILHLTRGGDPLRKLMNLHLRMREEDSEPEYEAHWVKPTTPTERGVISQLPVSVKLPYPLECRHLDISTENLGEEAPEDDSGSDDESEAADLAAEIARNASFSGAISE